MFYRIVCILTAAVIPIAVFADFLEDFTAARTLFEKRHYADAATAFEKLSKEQKDPALIDKCRSFAARSIGKQEKLSDALSAAAEIGSPHIRDFTRMLILSDNGKWRSIREEFKNTELGKWPDDINYRALYLRGIANSIVQMPKGIKDFEAAKQLAGSDHAFCSTILQSLTEAYLTAGMRDKAYSAIEENLALNRKGSLSFHIAVRTRAAMLIEDKRFEEAERDLNLIDIKEQWRPGMTYFWFLLVKADLESACGKTKEAEKLYGQAYSMEKIPEAILNQQKKLREKRGEKQ